MRISTQFSEPTSRAFNRMKTILFRPFNAEKWFLLGFSAWLATLGEGGSSYQGDFPTDSNDGEDGATSEVPTFESFQEVLFEAKEWIQANPWVIGVGIGLFILIVAFVVLITWLNARGKFMLLDNVVHNRAEVKKPWSDFKSQGNSLFCWIICFHLISGFLILSVLGGAGYWIYSILSVDESLMNPVIGIGVGALSAVILIAIATGYIWTLLVNFVVPQMYKFRIGVSEAWKKVIDLHRERFVAFLAFYLWYIILAIVSFLAVLAFGLMTCCIGFLAMAIPYIGAVLTLPITVFFCALGPEFARQFGPEYDLWEDSSLAIET